MTLRQVGAVLLALLTACSGTPRVQRSSVDDGELGPEVARYELSVLSPGAVRTRPVKLDQDAFTQAVARLIHEVPPDARPHETARRLFPSEREVEFVAQVEDGRVVRMAPLGEARPPSRTEAELTREYLHWCQRAQGGGDCLRLLVDGPTLRGDDRYALALALALGSVLDETRHALREQVQPQALLALIVWSVTVYFGMWLVPEPFSKGLAAVLTVGLLAWLGVETVGSLLRGWGQLVKEAGRATSFQQLSAAGEKYGRVLGENSARVLVMLAAAALGGSAARMAQQVPKLPGFAQASAQAEAQAGLRLAAVGEVETVAASAEGTFSLMVRSPGGRGGAASAGPRGAATTVIRHQGGNRQVVLNGQRWHVPANKPLKAIPRADPVGDQLQTAATRAAQRWGPHNLRAEEKEAIVQATSRGEHWLARLLERQARGRFVERTLREQFRHLQWSQTGVDVMDPATGYKYEPLSGSESNMALHGTRMAKEFFRMITF